MMNVWNNAILYIYSFASIHVLDVNGVLGDIQQQYIGCYRDGGIGNRVMTSGPYQNGSMTIDMCQQHCQQSANMYFGLEVTILSIDHSVITHFHVTHQLSSQQIICSPVTLERYTKWQDYLTYSRGV